MRLTLETAKKTLDNIFFSIPLNLKFVFDSFIVNKNYFVDESISSEFNFGKNKKNFRKEHYVQFFLI